MTVDIISVILNTFREPSKHTLKINVTIVWIQQPNPWKQTSQKTSTSDAGDDKHFFIYIT